jgi:2-polyprenyl-3-methyl-5-hydroxy-6-metoxy-1,4-benzoquinol methylase
VATRSTNCAICESTDFARLYALPNGEIVRCKGCGTVCRANVIAGEEAVRLYDDREYFDTPFFDALKVGAPKDVEPFLVYRRVLDRLEDTAPKGRLLDVGCAYGAFLEVAAERGWDPHGVDLSELACEYSRKERNLTVFHGSLEQAKYPDAHFSVVTLWDVIEHLDRPVDTLREVRRILAPSGIIFVFTINQASLVNRIGHYLSRLSLGRYSRPLALLYDIHHNFFFDESTLTTLLNKTGFSCLVAIDGMDAAISRWKTVPISPLMTFGSNTVDLAARALGGRYRLLIYASYEG